MLHLLPQLAYRPPTFGELVVSPRTPTVPLDDPRMWRRLVARTHPDAGGDHELQSLLFLLSYTNGLLNENDIATALKVARTDWTPEEGAA